MQVLKECKFELAASIANLVNQCLSEERFPQLWKEAVVVRIPKVEGANHVGDYRPISLLLQVSKIAESHVYGIAL